MNVFKELNGNRAKDNYTFIREGDRMYMMYQGQKLFAGRYIIKA